MNSWNRMPMLFLAVQLYRPKSRSDMGVTWINESAVRKTIDPIYQRPEWIESELYLETKVLWVQKQIRHSLDNQRMNYRGYQLPSVNGTMSAHVAVCKYLQQGFARSAVYSHVGRALSRYGQLVSPPQHSGHRVGHHLTTDVYRVPLPWEKDGVIGLELGCI